MLKMIVISLVISFVVNVLMSIYLVKSVAYSNDKMIESLDELIDKKIELNNYQPKK